nr:MAG TPA: hypothetical protein [Caudoviricetes sp.]
MIWDKKLTASVNLNSENIKSMFSLLTNSHPKVYHIHKSKNGKRESNE